MPNRAQLPPPPGAAAPGVSNSDPTRCRRARSTSLDPRKAMGHVPAHKYEPKPTAQTPRIAGDGRVCARALHTLRGARRQAGSRRLPPFSFFSKLRDDSTPSLILLDCTGFSTAHYVVEYLSIPRYRGITMYFTVQDQRHRSLALGQPQRFIRTIDRLDDHTGGKSPGGRCRKVAIRCGSHA